MDKGVSYVFLIASFLVIAVAGFIAFEIFYSPNISYFTLEIQPDSIKLDNVQSKVNLSVSLSENSVSPDSIISIIFNGSNRYEETIPIFLLPSNPTSLSFSYGNLDVGSLETITLVPMLEGEKGKSVLGQISNVYNLKTNKVSLVETKTLVGGSTSLTKIIQSGGSIRSSSSSGGGGSSSGGSESGSSGGSNSGEQINVGDNSENNQSVSENTNVSSNESIVVNQTITNQTTPNLNITSNESVVGNQSVNQTTQNPNATNVVNNTTPVVNATLNQTTPSVNVTVNQSVVNNTNGNNSIPSNLTNASGGHVFITASKDTALWDDTGNAGYYERGLATTFDYRHASRVGFYYFDLSGIPKDAVIQNATLELYSVGFNLWDGAGRVPIFLVQTLPPNDNIEWVEGSGVSYYSQYGGTSWNAKSDVRTVNGGYYDRPTYLWSKNKGRFAIGDLASAYYKNKPVGEMNFVKALGQQNSTDLSDSIKFIINNKYEYEGFGVDMYKLKSNARKDTIATREYPDESKRPQLEIVYTLKDNSNSVTGFFTKIFNELFS